MTDKEFEDLEILAKKHIMGLETLATRNSDNLDFHNIAVWQLADLIKDSFEEGKKTLHESDKISKG